MERVAGIEPASSAWKAEVLPLNYTRYEIQTMNRYKQDNLEFPRLASLKSGGGGWIRTSEAFASDLQSDPFGRSGTPPFAPLFYLEAFRCQAQFLLLFKRLTLTFCSYHPVCQSLVTSASQREAHSRVTE